MERYIKEYANAKIKEIRQCKLMNSQYKKRIIERINKALYLRNKEMIAADEAIEAILNAEQSVCGEG
jgi:hypothetical protein